MPATKRFIFQGVTDIEGKPKRIGKSTYQYYRKNGDRVIRLYQTDIIVFTTDGKIVLNSGGHRTITTKERFKHLPTYIVFQDDYEWFVAHCGDRDGAIPFYDGMVLPDAFEKVKEEA